METKQLRTFVMIAETQSFTRAGRRLGLSQSAISQQISALERRVGVKLLMRSGSGAHPTAAGEVLLQYARRILQKLEEVQRVLADEEATGRGLLRIGAGGAACRYLLPGVLQECHERFPRLELRVVSGSTRMTLERLEEGDLDVGLVTLPVSQPRLRVVELGREELVAIVTPSHPWAQRRRVLASDFAGQPLLVYDRRSRAFQLIERLLFEAGVFPRITMEMDQVAAVMEMTRLGSGVAVVPRWAVDAEVARGELVALSIGKGAVTRSWGLAFLEPDHGGRALKAFVRLCTDRLPRLLAA